LNLPCAGNGRGGICPVASVPSEGCFPQSRKSRQTAYGSGFPPIVAAHALGLLVYCRQRHDRARGSPRPALSLVVMFTC
jgi:hypothetical protein